MQNPKTIKIDEVEYIRADSIKKPEEMFDGYVIVRTYSAGCHFGKIVSQSEDGKKVVLNNSRRLWYWSGAASLSQMAVDGVSDPDNCKFPVAVPEITLTEAIEIIPVTKKAFASIVGVKIWSR